jgi:hypothetical protein
LLVSAGVVTVVNAVFHMAVHAHRTGFMDSGPTRWI